eukprot:scaffold2448_cov119-Isochrysis_galbana.AAC.9
MRGAAAAAVAHSSSAKGPTAHSSANGQCWEIREALDPLDARIAHQQSPAGIARHLPPPSVLCSDLGELLGYFSGLFKRFRQIACTMRRKTNSPRSTASATPIISVRKPSATARGRGGSWVSSAVAARATMRRRRCSHGQHEISAYR